MNRKFNPIIAVGAVLLLVGVVVLAVLAGRGGGDAKKVRALVAVTDIAAGTAGDKANLKIQEVPASQVPAGSPSQQTALVGLFAKGKIPAGQIITADSFGGIAAATAAGISLHAGKQAIGVELQFAPGVLRYVVAGNRVNIYVTTKPKESPDGTVVVGKTLLLTSDVLVLRTTPGLGDGNGATVTPGVGAVDLLLEVDQQQAEKIVAVAGNPNIDIMYFTISKTGQS